MDEAIEIDQSLALMGQICLLPPIGGTVVTQVSIATDRWHYYYIKSIANQCYRAGLTGTAFYNLY